MLQEIDLLAAQRADFAFETTLSGLGYVRRILAWKRAGYKIEIVYLKLRSNRLALPRIAARVQEGGHDVPRSDVVRRFARGDNFLPAAGERMDGIRRFGSRAAAVEEE